MKRLVMAVIGLAIGVLWHQNSELSKEVGSLNSDKESAEAVAKNVIASVSIFNQITESNQNAKSQYAGESQRVKSVVQAIVKNDDCGGRIVPVAAVERLHEYANGLRSGSVDPATF